MNSPMPYIDETDEEEVEAAVNAGVIKVRDGNYSF